MTGTICAIPQCNSRHKIGDKLMFHRYVLINMKCSTHVVVKSVKYVRMYFPHFSVVYRLPNDPKLRRSWLKIIRTKRKDEVNPKNIRICERHFDSEDYEPDLTSVILFYSYKLSE